MNTNRIAPVVGAAAVLLALSACAGVDGQFADTARAESSLARVEARVPNDRTRALTLEETAVRDALQARVPSDRMLAMTLEQAAVRESLQAHAGSVSVHERIRATKQAESGSSQSTSSTPAPTVQELVRSVKQAEHESQ